MRSGPSPAESRCWDVDAGSAGASPNAIIIKPLLNQCCFVTLPATAMGSYWCSQSTLPASWGERPISKVLLGERKNSN